MQPRAQLAGDQALTSAGTAQAPYVGLRPYEPEEHEWFFGRDQDAVFLGDKIVVSPLTILYSASGLGKSSLLRALVMPRLEEGGSLVVYFDAWTQEDPTGALAQILGHMASELGVPSADAGAPTLLELVRLIGSVDRRPVVLVLDQFEEFLITHGQQLDPLRKQLAALVRAGQVGAQVVLSLREEFLGALEPFRQEFLNLFQSTYRLEPLDNERISQAIRLPPERFGGACDADLVEALIGDLKAESTGYQDASANAVDLPMLQLVCSELWDAAKDRHLTLALYEQMGGARLLLDTYVRAAMPRRWRDQHLTARMMRLLAPPSGLKMSFSAGDLAANLNADAGRVETELARLGHARILRERNYSSGVRYELQHDAFIRVVAPWRDRFLRRVARLRVVAWSVAVGLIVLGIVGGASYLNWRHARELLVRDLVSHTNAERLSRPNFAIMLGVAARGLALDPALERLSEEALRAALSNTGGLVFGAQRNGGIATVAVSRTGARLAIGGVDDVLAWDTRAPSRSVMRLPLKRVRLLAISDDGRWLAAASTDQRVLVWRIGDVPAASPVPLEVGGPVRALAFSPGGDRLVVGTLRELVFARRAAQTNQATKAAVWSAEPGANPRLPLPEQSEVFALAFSADARFVLAGISSAEGSGSRGRVLRWDLGSRAVPAGPEVLWDDAAEGYRAMALGAYGQWHAALGLDDNVRVWKLQPGHGAVPVDLEPVPAGSQPTSKVQTLAFSPEAPTLALASDNVVTVWNLETRAQERVLRGHDKPVEALALSEDGRSLASASADDARLWDLDDPVADPRTLGDSDPVTLTFWPADQRVVVSSGQGVIRRLGAMGRGTVEALLPKPVVSSNLSVQAVSRSGRWLAAGAEGGHLLLWGHPFDGAARLVGLHEFGDAVLALAFSPDERWLAAGSADKTLGLWDLRLGTPALYPGKYEGEVGSLVFSSDGRWLAAGSWRGEVVLWDLRASNPSPVALAGTKRARIQGMTFDTTGRYLFAGDANGTLLVWDTNGSGTPRLVPKTGFSINSISDVAFHPDERRLAIGSTEGTFVLEDFWTQSSVRRVDESLTNAVSFSPDGDRLATGSFEGVVKVWDLADLSPDAGTVLPGPQTAIRRLSFSPDGRVLAAFAGSRTYLWAVRTPDLLDVACRTVGLATLPAEACGEMTTLGLNCAICAGTAPAR